MTARNSVPPQVLARFSDTITRHRIFAGAKQLLNPTSPDPNPAVRRRHRRHRRLPPGFVAVAELAQRAECAASTIYDNVAKGRIAAAKWRGVIIIHDDAADEFLTPQPLRAGTPEGTSEILSQVK